MSVWRQLLARALRVAAASAEGRRTLPFTLQHQLQTNWCWAACAASASLFYDRRSRWAQCVLVNAELKGRSCCQDGAAAACNRPHYLDRALRRTGNFRERRAGAVPWATVRAEIDAGRPVGARVGWRGGGGHFVMLTGYRRVSGSLDVEVQDPWTGNSMLPISQFATNYKGLGTWTHTYLTRS
jgi:hypothetical protein